jgi:hypothetical protein
MKIVMVYAISWVGMVVLAILNGVIRERVYGQLMRELTAHQLSTLVGIVLFGIYIWVLTGLFTIQSSRQALVIGSMWFIITIVFEFGFGHYAMKHSWSKLFHDYNIFEGRVWVLVLIWIVVAPYLFYRLRS